MTEEIPLPKLPETDAAYIAGLIDGEGTVTLTRKHKNENRQLAVTISNTDRTLLEYVQQTLGVGKITAKRTSQLPASPSPFITAKPFPFLSECTHIYAPTKLNAAS